MGDRIRERGCVGRMILIFFVAVGLAIAFDARHFNIFESEE